MLVLNFVIALPTDVLAPTGATASVGTMLSLALLLFIISFLWLSVILIHSGLYNIISNRIQDLRKKTHEMKYVTAVWVLDRCTCHQNFNSQNTSIISSKHQWHNWGEAKPMIYIPGDPRRPTLSVGQTRLLTKCNTLPEINIFQGTIFWRLNWNKTKSSPVAAVTLFITKNNKM